MKSYVFFILLCMVIFAGTIPGQALAEGPAREKAGAASREAPPLSAKPGSPVGDAYTDDEISDYADDPFAEESVTIADPIEPFNRVMHQVNDKMYFWLIKPVARGYRAVVPEPARVSVDHFFSNLRSPARIVSCLLQTDFAGAGEEAGRFIINTVWGIGGLMDPAAGGALKLQMQDTDLGQTLAVYGIGHGFYIVWPFLGPSSPRDSATILGDQFLYPLSFYQIWYASIVGRGLEAVNTVSLRRNDYESLIEAAIDPYLAIRNAYIQYRMKDVKARQARSVFFKSGEDNRPATDASGTGK